MVPLAVPVGAEGVPRKSVGQVKVGARHPHTAAVALRKLPRGAYMVEVSVRYKHRARTKVQSFKLADDHPGFVAGIYDRRRFASAIDDIAVGAYLPERKRIVFVFVFMSGMIVHDMSPQKSIGGTPQYAAPRRISQLSEKFESLMRRFLRRRALTVRTAGAYYV